MTEDIMPTGSTRDGREYLDRTAAEILDRLDEIATVARRSLEEFTPIGASTSAIRPVTAGVQEGWNHQNAWKLGSCRALAREPAIARVVVAGPGNENLTYYICRDSTINGISSLASYLSPIGRLVSQRIGTRIARPDGQVVEVLEKALLYPVFSQQAWDSEDSSVETASLGPFTIESLQQYLQQRPLEGEEKDILDRLLEEEQERRGIFDGLRRRVIHDIGLRDQPILDEFQDDIFRLPLDSRLLILGPPGTGKTTTLIRRLGQKCKPEFLSEDERRSTDELSQRFGIDHSTSWQMFSPTRLLGLYLKEAFARERVPASDHHISTWDDYRRELGRAIPGVLRTAAERKGFVLREDQGNLKGDSRDRQIAWFEDFERWQRRRFAEKLSADVEFLRDCDLLAARQAGERARRALSLVGQVGLGSTLLDLERDASRARQLVHDLRIQSDARIKAALNLQLNRDPSFLEKLGDLLDALAQQVTPDEGDLDIEDDEEEEIPILPSRIEKIILAFMKAARAQARAHFARRSLRKETRDARIVEWLGARTLPEAEQVMVGKDLRTRASLLSFVDPVGRYLGGIAGRYREFRRVRRKEGAWYSDGKQQEGDINPLELDLVLLSFVRAAASLSGREGAQENRTAAGWELVARVTSRLRSQILVDEATDFSPIQLACMRALAHPRLNSFFACGDFDQRITAWGTRTLDDLKWACPDLECRTVSIVYRQSRRLMEFARALAAVIGGTAQEASFPENFEGEGVPPALLESSTKEGELAWLAERIREVEQFVGRLPSIAVFVGAEEAVVPTAKYLKGALEGETIQVVGCAGGESLGQDTCVRVFDIEHIKGLEFEAAFFVGVDRLANDKPEVFERFLYVGATRAATYLGVTCEGQLPPSLEPLRLSFCPDWRGLTIGAAKH